jgi:hypothetical protein
MRTLGYLLNPPSRAILAEYLRTSDRSESDLLLIWRGLREAFPLLCGDPPPIRWLPELSHWMTVTGQSDTTFIPIVYRFNWDIPTDSLLHPSTLLSLEFLATDPVPVGVDFAKLVDSLTRDSARILGLCFDSQG